MKKIIIMFIVLFQINDLYANKTSMQLNAEFREMLHSLEQSCSHYKEYYPYKVAQDVLQKHKIVERFKDYEYNSIFSAGFLNFDKVDDCRPVAIGFIIEGIQWLQRNQLITSDNNFFDLIYREYARALVYKFYITGEDSLLDQAVDILNNYFLEHHTLESYNKLAWHQRRKFKEGNIGNGFRYYNPNDYYLATMTLVPDILFEVPVDRLETLLVKTQKFENRLLQMAGKPFEDYESATLRIFTRLLWASKKNQEQYHIYAQKVKEHVFFLQQNGYIDHNSCNYLGKFSNDIDREKVEYADLTLWFKFFYKKSCYIAQPFDEFIVDYINNHPIAIVNNEPNELIQKKMIHQASKVLLKFAVDYNNPNICRRLKSYAYAKDNIVTIMMENKKFWNRFTKRFCQ